MMKVAITDDHLLVMQGIESMLQNESSIHITGKYPSAEKTLEALVLVMSIPFVPKEMAGETK